VTKKKKGFIKLMAGGDQGYPHHREGKILGSGKK